MGKALVLPLEQFENHKVMAFLDNHTYFSKAYFEYRDASIIEKHSEVDFLMKGVDSLPLVKRPQPIKIQPDALQYMKVSEEMKTFACTYKTECKRY